MQITSRINSARLQKAFKRFSTEDKRAVLEEVVRKDAIGFVRDVVAITPPGHAGKKLVSGAKGEAAVEAGRNKIRHDLLQIIYPLPDDVINKALSFDQGLGDNVRLWVNKAGKVYGVERALFRPDATIEMIYDHHQRYFKRGRMTQAGTFTRDIGRWKFVDRFVIRESTWRQYLDYVWEKMGTLAGAWGKAAAQLRVRMPKIASRHRSGEFLPISKPDAYRVRITNTVTFASQADMDRRANWVLDSGKRKRRLAKRMQVEIEAKLKSRLTQAG